MHDVDALLTLAHGVTRVQLVLERALALFLPIILLSALVFVLVRALNDPAHLGIRPENLFGATVLISGLALLSGSVALFFGTVTGRRVYGIMPGAGVAIMGYIFNAIGRQSSDVEWLLNRSPYHWAYGTSPVTNGADWSVAAWLWGISVVLVLLAAAALARRDVGTK